MIIYLVKSTILLALLLGVFKLFLENEKMHTFNRFFLLAALILGLTAPLVQINVSPDTTIAGLEIAKVESTVNAPSEFVAKSIEPIISDTPSAAPIPEAEGATPIQSQSEKPLFSRQQVLLFLYGLITLFFLIRFGLGLFELFSKVRLGTKSTFKNSTLILLDEKITPQSFLTWIFLNKSNFESGKIDPEILEHELTHIRQKHSLDILFIELIKTVFWFNPIFYFYKHAIQLNHEFLADEGAINNFDDVQNYQSILLGFASEAASQKITSRFDFSPTKKRFHIMGKRSSLLQKNMRLFLLLPCLSISVFLFCSKIPHNQTSGKFVSGSFLEPEDSDPDLYHDVALVYKKEVSPNGAVHLYFDETGEYFTGVRKTFFTTGDIYSERIYKDGLLINVKRYNLEGKPTTESTFEYRNKVLYLMGYYEDGALKSEHKYHPDDLEEFKFFYKNGTTQIEGYWDLRTENGALTGLYSQYDSLGVLTMRHVYNNGVLLEEIK